MNLGTYDATIDFSKLFVHNSTSIYFKEGDLNTAKVRAKLTMQGKSIDITGCNIVVKIETMTGQKINDVATIIDATNGIVEIDFKSNSLVEGTNFFELKIVKGESVKESPKLAYRVLDSIEDAGSIEGTNEYPILIQLINDTNKAIEDANEALELANTMKTNLEEVIDNANSAISNATDATNNANTAATNATSKITEVDNAKNDMTTKVDESIDTMKSEVTVAKNDMKITVDEAIKFLKQEFNSLTAQQQEELELLQARDGEVNLNARLERDLYIDGKSLKQEVLDLGVLKESQEMSYSTDKGYLVCKETKAGTVKDLKISGKSLVQLIPSNSWKVNPGIRLETTCVTGDLINRNLTFINNSDKVAILETNTDAPGVDGNYSRAIRLEPNKATYLEFKNEYIRMIQGRQQDGWIDDDLELIKKSVYILEGDHTQNPPPFFEGIASVGTEVDKIEVSSVKSDGNLVGSLQFDEEESVRITANELFTVSLESKDSTGSNVPQVVFLDSNKNIIDFFNITQKENDRYFRQFTLNKEIFFIKIKSSTSVKIDIDKICVNLGTNKTYIEVKQDKKTLLYKDNDGIYKSIPILPGYWEGDEFKWGDTIEEHDGKQYWHNRTILKTINGSENWVKQPSDTLENTDLYECRNLIENNSIEYKIFSTLPYYRSGFEKLDVVGLFSYSSQGYINDLCIRIPKGQDINAYLQANNIPIVYLSNKEKIHEVAPLFLESYEGETTALVNSGVVSAPIEFKITSYITNLVLLNQQRISILENELYKTNLANFTVALNTLDTKLRLEQLTKAPR